MIRRLIRLSLLLIIFTCLCLFAFNSVQGNQLLRQFPLFRSLLHLPPEVTTFPLNLKTTPATLRQKINTYRQNHQLPPFADSAAICEPYQTTDATIDQPSIFSLCPACVQISLVKITKFSTVEMLMAELTRQTGIQTVLDSSQMNLLCIKEESSYLNLLFARIKPASQTPITPLPIAIVTVPTKTPTEFTEAELWQALTTYRQSQRVSPLQLDDNLCRYARSRVEEHIAKMASTPPSEYPVPAKYPLDAHAGFSRDAENNSVFETTGFNHIAENLAYWPTAQNAIHVIEWGWDSSTEGHRETQLSNEFTHACLSGRQGFFVAIFAAR